MSAAVCDFINNFIKAYVRAPFLYALPLSFFVLIIIIAVVQPLAYFFPSLFISEYEVTLIEAIIVAPVVETLLIALVVGIMSSFKQNRTNMIIASVIIFGLLHAWNEPITFFTSGFAFFFFTVVYLEGRKTSIWKGLGLSILLHMCCNGIGYSMQQVAELLSK